MNYSEITPYIKELAALSDTSNHIVPEMYAQHDVKRGLRVSDKRHAVGRKLLPKTPRWQEKEIQRLRKDERRM